MFEFEQGNYPDYLGYHLRENFEEWYATQNQRLSFSKIEDLSIVTDGIFSFQPFDVDEYDMASNREIIDWLLKDSTFEQYPAMLKKKLLYIEKTWGLKPSDDLSIVRLMF